jgi:hypothetical protein
MCAAEVTSSQRSSGLGATAVLVKTAFPAV